MTARQLAPLDVAFLEIEGPAAHMHVGFVAVFARSGADRGFEALRDHIALRLAPAPRYRQRLASPPLGLGTPAWVDDADFDVTRHILHAKGSDLPEVVSAVMSVPLERDRPLWEIWIADRLADGRLGLVGKLHHSMVDGIAALELAGLLLDAEPEPDTASDASPGDGLASWQPDDRPRALQATAAALAGAARDAFSLTTLPLRVVRHPRQVFNLPGATLDATRTLVGAVAPGAPASRLNGTNSPLRHLASVRRPLADLQRIKRAHGTTINDVVLAACAGALGRFLSERGEEPDALRAMVPVNVRDGAADELGNGISFLFVDLPCQELDPTRRLASVHADTARRKDAGEAGHAKAVIGLLGQMPGAVRRAASHLLASPRIANVVVSNIPGPPVAMYLAGCELEEAYPIVPLSDRHAVSIGMLTVQGQACFGLYADRKTLPDVEALAGHLDAALDDLLTTTGPAAR